MQRRITIICIAVALLASARPACCAARAADPGRGQEPGAPPAQQSRRVGVRGKITRLQPTRGRAAPDGVLGTMLVEGQKAADTEVDKALVSLTAETRLARGNETLRFTDLALGQRVEVRFAGPVRRSYPIQATAAEVAVLARGDDAAPAATGSSAPLDERGPGVSVHSLTYGLMFKRAAAREPFLVTRVVAGSAAALAGLRPGDTILSLNGATAATMTPSQLQEELWKEGWALQVRVGADKATRLIGLKGVRASSASPPAKHKKNE